MPYHPQQNTGQATDGSGKAPWPLNRSSAKGYSPRRYQGSRPTRLDHITAKQLSFASPPTPSTSLTTGSQQERKLHEGSQTYIGQPLSSIGSAGWTDRPTTRNDRNSEPAEASEVPRIRSRPCMRPTGFSSKEEDSTVKPAGMTTSVRSTNTNPKTRTGGTSIFTKRKLFGTALVLAGLGYAWHYGHLEGATTTAENGLMTAKEYYSEYGRPALGQAKEYGEIAKSRISEYGGTAFSRGKDYGGTAMRYLTDFADTAKNYASGYGIGGEAWKKPPSTYASKLSEMKDTGTGAASSAWNTGTSLASNAWENAPSGASNAWWKGSEAVSKAYGGGSEMASNAKDWYQAGGVGSAYETSKSAANSVLPTTVKDGGLFLYEKGTDCLSRGVSNVGEWYANGGAGEAYDTARGVTVTGLSTAGSVLRTAGSMARSASDWFHR